MPTRPKRQIPLPRVPTPEEFAAYDGAHCFVLWRGLPADWRCPACNRSKFQILSWTRRFKPSATGERLTYMGWLAGLDKHHDHSHQGQVGTAPRFAETTLCKHCNAADGTAKRVLRLPADFSFAPWEIARFVRPTAHGSHEICYETARSIYEAVARQVRFW